MKNSEQFWQKSILKFDSSIQQAISNLNNSGLKIVLVVNDKNEFIGTISDGDIRRGLLANLNINDAIDKVIEASTAGISVDLEAAAEGLGYDSFADAVAAYNAANGTSYTEQQARDALGQ